MRKNEKGLSLIEVIFSMWIIAIVIFSTAVCTSGMNAEFNQRRLQALNIAKSELEHIKYLASLGSLRIEFNGGTAGSGTRDYTIIRSVTDNRNIRVVDSFNSQTGKTETNPDGRFERSSEKDAIIFDSLPGVSESEVAGRFRSSLNFSLRPGYLIEDVKSKDQRALLRDILRSEELGNLESEGKKSFIIDVNVRFSEELKDSSVTANPSANECYLYEVRVAVAWLERSGGAEVLSTQNYYTRVLSNVTPYYKNKTG